MIFKYITVKNFGSVQCYDVVLGSKLNVLDTLFTAEISAAVELLLCKSAIPVADVKKKTLIRAEVLLDERVYSIELKPTDGGSLKLTATDTAGNDATDFYRHAMSHCSEQDATENFDGRDTSLPLRLCWYRGCDEDDVPNDLASRTNRMIDTKTFRSHLIRYIKAFEPEPINNKKKYKTSINKEGKFEVLYPGLSGEIPLSETEEKLFLYICFLNMAEFWEEVEKIRDMHHEKKPLLIQNFLEFLDQTTDIQGLITRTLQLGRQVILLTLPMDEKTKRKWIGENNEHRKISRTQKKKPAVEREDFPELGKKHNGQPIRDQRG